MPSTNQPAQAAPSASTTSIAPQSRWSLVWHSPLWMVLIAFAVRVLWIALAHTYRFRTTEANFGFGFEIGRLAYSLANGHGFSSPFGGDTGPSAWNPPIYPWILSLAFRAFGSYSHAAAFAMLVFNSVFAALTSWTVYRIARRVFGETVALWSGWVWALYPDTIYWSVKWIWETSLSAFLLSLLFMLTLEMEGDERPSSWLGYGLLWGVAALTNPAALSFLPFAGCWLLYQFHRRGRRFAHSSGRNIGARRGPRFVVPVVLSAVVFWMTIMPWLVRNHEVFSGFVFVRDNFGNEQRIGNNPMAEGMYVLAYHPSNNALLYAKYKRMGEPEFCSAQGRLAREWVAQHPGRFATVSLRRFYYFWNGIPRLSRIQWLAETKNTHFLLVSVLGIWGLLLALQRRVHGVFLFASLLAFYPLVYYICFPEPRYRHPIDPELLILGVYLISQAQTRSQTRDRAEELPEASPDEVLPQFHTLSVIIPVYNERKTVMELLTRVARQPLSLHKELIIVDDCSSDGTRELLRETDLPALLGGNGANTVKLVLHEKNQGKGAGVRSALQHVTGELVLIQDADLEYDPRDYPQLITPILEGHADAVFGNRFHDGPHRVPRYWRYVLNRCFSLLCNMLTGLSIHDVTACYKVFRRELFSQMQIRSDRFSIETEITVKLAKLGARIYEVPIVYHGRTYAEGKKISWTDGVIAVYHLLWYRFKD